VALAAASLIHASTFSTVGDENAGVGVFGSDYTNTYGETFVAPGGDLTSFTFYFYGSGTTNVTAEVYAWSGILYGGNSPQGTMGSALFSAPVTITGDSLTVDTGLVPLAAGDSYIVLLTNPSNDNYPIWALDLNAHPSGSGGGGFNLNNGPAAGTYYDEDFGTLEYTASFGAAPPVPEPSSLILLCTGVLCLAGFVRRRAL
jgi:hypothetical protein